MLGAIPPTRPFEPSSDCRISVSIGRIVLALCVGFALAAPAVAVEPRPPRLKACFVSLNEPDELNVFRASLDPNDFELIDIRARAAAARPAQKGAAEIEGGYWLADACSPDVSCDLVIYSAEFAGRFFGKNGPPLSLQEMEEASCQRRCDGLFRRPREVFLLACNTLATKDEDSRTPEEYLNVLLDHGFDRSSAERVVELRYGPLGPSFRESLRRVFAGVPRIYGFSSVAPRGMYSAPMLSNYFKTHPDYATTFLRSSSSSTRNAALYASFKGTSFTQTTGLTPSEAGAVDRERICDLYDESLPVTERLRIAYGLLLRSDALRFIPTLEVFLSRHPPKRMTRVEKSILAEIQGLDATRDEVLDLVRSLNVSALKLELAHFAVLVGWLHRQEFHTLAVNGARELLGEPLTPEVVDIMCEITKYDSLSADFAHVNISPSVYADPHGLRLIACLAPADPRISAEVLPALKSTNPEERVWAAHTLVRLVPRDEEVLRRIAPYVNDPSPDVSRRIRWIFLAQKKLPRGLERMLRNIDPTLLEERARYTS
jgi:hypothetical protein